MSFPINDTRSVINSKQLLNKLPQCNLITNDTINSTKLLIVHRQPSGNWIITRYRCLPIVIILSRKTSNIFYMVCLCSASHLCRLRNFWQTISIRQKLHRSLVRYCAIFESNSEFFTTLSSFPPSYLNYAMQCKLLPATCRIASDIPKTANG